MLTGWALCTKKLTIVVPKQKVTTAKIATLVFANIEAPIKQINKFSVFRAVQYKNLCHGLSGINALSPTKNPVNNHKILYTVPGKNKP